jgi:hypothetical protein
MIGKRPEITRMADLIEALRSAKHDKLKILEQATAREVEAYLRQNSQFSHDIIVVSHR